MLKSVNDVPGLKRKRCPACKCYFQSDLDQSFLQSVIALTEDVLKAESQTEVCATSCAMTLLQVPQLQIVTLVTFGGSRVTSKK